MKGGEHMKSYQDFISTLSDEKCESITREILENREPAPITEAVPEISFKISLKLLELYHEWLHN